MINDKILEWLKTELSVLSQNFKDIQLRIGYNVRVEVYLVEISPLESYFHNEELDFAWMDIADRFSKKFSLTGLSFINQDSDLADFEAIYEWKISEDFSFAGSAALESFVINNELFYYPLLSSDEFVAQFGQDATTSKPYQFVSSTLLKLNIIDMVSDENNSLAARGNTQYSMAA